MALRVELLRRYQFDRNELWFCNRFADAREGSRSDSHRLGLDDLLAEGLLLPDFYSTAVSLSARFREAFSARCFSRWQSRVGILNAVRSGGVSIAPAQGKGAYGSGVAAARFCGHFAARTRGKMSQVGTQFPRLWLAGCAMLASIVVQCCSAIRQARIDHMIANADSPADHEAIAAAYEQEAANNEAEAATHLKIAERYDRRPHWRFDCSKLCRQLAQHYTDLGRGDAELAHEHLKMAE